MIKSGDGALGPPEGQKTDIKRMVSPGSAKVKKSKGQKIQGGMASVYATVRVGTPYFVRGGRR